MIFPLRPDQHYTLGYLFNQRTWYGLPHEGVDLIVPVGTRYLACFNGTVTYAGYGPDLGYRVEYVNDRWLFKAGHFSEIFCKKGDRVTEGEVLALSGKTGLLAGTTPHIHWAVYDRLTGKRVDPLSLTYGVSTLDQLRKSINDVFRDIFGRLPTVKENSYYLARIHPGDITTEAQLREKMEYWESMGTTMGK